MGGSVYVCWRVLSNELSREPGSFSHCCNPHTFLQPEVLRLNFPALEPWVVRSVLLPSYSSRLIHMQMWGCLVCQLLPCTHSSLPFHDSSPAQLPISTPPTSLGECFFFKSLVVGLPYSSIFWQFWLLFLNLLSFFWWCEEGRKAYLTTPPSWLEIYLGLLKLLEYSFI